MFLRLYLAGTLLLFALVTAASGPSLSALLAGAAAIFFGTPTVIRGLLAPLERRVLAASRSEASDLLGELRQRKLVKLFAPFAWQSVQEARLHLRRGDGKAAVKALAETARQSIGGEQSPVLLSARGYAHLLAGEPDEAARLLRARAEQGALTPVDRLHLGLASLLSKGGSRSEPIAPASTSRPRARRSAVSRRSSLASRSRTSASATPTRPRARSRARSCPSGKVMSTIRSPAI